MKIEFNLADLVKALDIVSIVSPRPVTASGASGYLFVVREGSCAVYSRDASCVAMSSFPLLSSDGQGQFVYPAEYINALRVLSSTADTCVIQATEKDEKFFVSYEASSGAKAERGSFDPRLLVTCDKDLEEASGNAQEIYSGVLREAITQARSYIGGKDSPDEHTKVLQILDATRPDYAKGDGFLYVSDGVRILYFKCSHFEGKSLEVHSQHLGYLTSFLAKSESVTIRKGQHFTFAVDGDGNAFGWPKPVKLHPRFGYYHAKTDTYVFKTPKVRLANAISHARSEADSKEEKIRLNFDPERRLLWFEIQAGSAKIEGIPVSVEVLPPVPDAALPPPKVLSYQININFFMELVGGLKGNEVELRLRIIPSESDRGEIAMFRTVDRFLLDPSGKVTTEPEGAVECMVTRFASSKS